MKSLIRPAVSLFLLLTLITGVFYPMAVTGIAKVAFPEAANGSLIFKDGKAVGSRLIGQNFTDPKYFWGRPSATSPQPYNASASGGSNLGPLNPALTDGVKGRIAALKAADPDNTGAIPADLVTASASGLDPHISPAAAKYQIERVAKARQILEDAGFTADENGNYIELEMLVFSSGSYADCGKVMQSNLKEAGINMKLTVLESAAWNERVTSGDFDMAMLNGYQGPDPDAMSKRIGTGGAANHSHFSNAEVDELLAKARSLTDNEARGACYRRIQEIEAEELPIIPVVEMATYYICRSNVSGIAYIDHVSDVSDNSYARVTID